MEILNLGSHRIGVRFPEKGLRKGKNPAILLNDGELIEQFESAHGTSSVGGGIPQ